MSPFKVVVLDDFQGIASQFADWDSLQGVETTFLREKIEGNSLVKCLADFDAVIAMRERTALLGDVLTRLPKLKLIVTTGMRNHAIDMVVARSRGVAIYGTDSLPYPAAELAWALLLALIRNIPAESANLRRGVWQQTIGRGLHGKTLGLVGLGKQGKQVARYGKAFGMKVIAWSENLTPDACNAEGVSYAAKDALFASSDVVSVHLVLSARSQGVVDATALSSMKSTAFLINTSRSALVDNDALVGVLQAGGIAGAGIDVFDVEPIKGDDPLLTLDNVLLTPHLGYVIAENYEIFYSQAVEAVENFRGGNSTRRIA